VASDNDAVMEISDPFQTSGILLAGTVQQQTGPFNNGSLNGLMVGNWQSVNPGDGHDESEIALFSCDGNGNFNNLVEDYNDAGTITEKPPFQITYSVAANGALSFPTQGNNVPAGFLISQNRAFWISTGENPNFGWFEPQTGGPFSNASLAGSYAGGSLAPLDYANGENDAAVGTADGAGTLIVNLDDSDPSGLGQDLGFLVTYSIAANGRGTAQAQGDQSASVVYMISPTKFLIMMPETDARLIVFEH